MAVTSLDIGGHRIPVAGAIVEIIPQSHRLLGIATETPH